MCFGAREVAIHAYTETAGAQTFDAAPTAQIYQRAGAALGATAAQSGIAVSDPSGADVNEGRMIMVTPVAGETLPIYSLGMLVECSAAVTGLTMDAYVSWD
jgi:hypothetical protein